MQSDELERCLICRKQNTDPKRRPTVELPFTICPECYTEHSSKLGHGNFDYFKEVAAITPLFIHDNPHSAFTEPLAKDDVSRQARAFLECVYDGSSGIDHDGDGELTLPMIDEEPFFIEFANLLAKDDEGCQAGALLECDTDGSSDLDLDLGNFDEIPRIEITSVDDDFEDTIFEDTSIPIVDELDELQEIPTFRPPTRRSEREVSPPPVSNETKPETGARGAVGILALQHLAEELDTVSQILFTHQPTENVDYDARIIARYQAMLEADKPPKLKKRKGRASLKVAVPNPKSEEPIPRDQPKGIEKPLPSVPQPKTPLSFSRPPPRRLTKPAQTKRPTTFRPTPPKSSSTSTSTQPKRSTTYTPTELKDPTPTPKSAAILTPTELKPPTTQPKSSLTAVRPTRAFTLRQQAAYLLQHADEPRGPKTLKSSRLPRAKGKKKKVQFVRTNLGRIDEERREEVEEVEEEEERGRTRTRD
jgi:hypothetical protein